MRMEEEELEIENWGWIKDIQGKGRGNRGLRFQIWGWRTVDWGWPIKIWGFNHALPSFNTHISGQPLVWIMLFWGHFKSRNPPLEDILKLFPGLLTECNAARNAMPQGIQCRTEFNAAQNSMLHRIQCHSKCNPTPNTMAQWMQCRTKCKQNAAPNLT